MCEECVQAIAAVSVLVPMVPIILSKAKGYVVNWSAMRLTKDKKSASTFPVGRFLTRPHLPRP